MKSDEILSHGVQNFLLKNNQTSRYKTALGTESLCMDTLPFKRTHSAQGGLTLKRKMAFESEALPGTTPGFGSAGNAMSPHSQPWCPLLNIILENERKDKATL